MHRLSLRALKSLIIMSNQLETNEISHRFFEEYLLVDLVISVFSPAYIFKTITEALKLSYYPHLPVTRMPAGSRPEITVDEKPQPSRPGLHENSKSHSMH